MKNSIKNGKRTTFGEIKCGQLFYSIPGTQYVKINKNDVKSLNIDGNCVSIGYGGDVEIIKDNELVYIVEE